MRNREKLVAVLAVALSVFLAVLGSGASAASSGSFSVVPECTAVQAGEDAVLELRLSRKTEIAGFRIFIFFNSAVFTYEETESSAGVAEDALRVSANDTRVAAVYVCGAESGGAPSLSGTVLSFRFRAGEGAPEGAAEFSVKLDETCDYDGNDLGMNLSQTLTVNIAGDAPSAVSSRTRSAGTSAASGSASRMVSSGNTVSREKTVSSESTASKEKTISSGFPSSPPETSSPAESAAQDQAQDPEQDTAQDTSQSAPQTVPDSQTADVTDAVIFSSDRERQLNVFLGTLLAVAVAAVLALLIVRRK